MLFTSWLRPWKSALAPTPLGTARRRPQPNRPSTRRLGVERLEDRSLLSTSVQGTVFNDVNGNGARDAGEPGLAGWTAYLDPNANSVLDPGEPAAATDAAGHYLFDTTGVPAVIGTDGSAWDLVRLDLQVGSGGRW